MKRASVVIKIEYDGELTEKLICEAIRSAVKIKEYDIAVKAMPENKNEGIVHTAIIKE